MLEFHESDVIPGLYGFLVLSHLSWYEMIFLGDLIHTAIISGKEHRLHWFNFWVVGMWVTGISLFSACSHGVLRHLANYSADTAFTT